MSDGRAAVVCLLCSPNLFVLFWFSVCFGYIVYSYISPSLFLSCSFASFCSPSKSHKVSLFLFFLLLLLTPRGSSPRRAASARPGRTIWDLRRLALPAPSPGPAVCLYVRVSDCLCVCPVATQPRGHVLRPVFQCPSGCPKGTLRPGQGPISASGASQGHPLHEPSPSRTACAQTGFFLPESYLQWSTEEVQFQTNLIKSVILCADTQTNLISIPDLSALQNCTLTGWQAC